MLVETADAAAVAMRITRAEWAALREADIRAAVDHALETHGLAPWTSMKIELFVAEKEVLLIARPISTPPRRFRFHAFADLAAALLFSGRARLGRGVHRRRLGAVRAHRGRGAAERALRVRRAAAVYRGTVRTHRRTRRRGRPP